MTALKSLFVIGILSSLIMLAVSGPVAAGAGYPQAKLSLQLISPALFFVSILSAYRGYFQGLQRMSPTAATQFIEQVVKLGAGLYIAYLWVGRGLEYGAAGALLGVTLSEAAALVIIIIMYCIRKKEIKGTHRAGARLREQPRKALLGELLRIAVPVTVGGCIMPIVGMIDEFLITNTLSGVNYSSFNILTPKQNFGVLTGLVNPLINMPAVFSLALCMSLVPSISESRAQKDIPELGSRSGMGFKLAVLIGLPCAVGMFILARPIMNLLYSSENIAAQSLVVGTELLKTLSVGVLFLTMLQTMTGILQGAGRQLIPLVTLGIGAVVKVILSVVLIRMPELNINGAAIGTAACYGVASILNVIAVMRVTKPSIRAWSGLVMPAVSAAVMGIFVYFVAKALMPDYNTVTSEVWGPLLTATLVCIAGAIVVYVIMLFVTGSLRKEDMKYIPGGRIITKAMNSIGLRER
jgi:stage V sporulation protein B